MQPETSNTNGCHTNSQNHNYSHPTDHLYSTEASGANSGQEEVAAAVDQSDNTSAPASTLTRTPAELKIGRDNVGTMQIACGAHHTSKSSEAYLLVVLFWGYFVVCGRGGRVECVLESCDLYF